MSVLFDNDEIAAHFSPDCFRILFFVPGARSSLGFPAIRHQPALVRMLELAMAAARAVKIPAVVFDEPDCFANFHSFNSTSNGF